MLSKVITIKMEEKGDKKKEKERKKYGGKKEIN